MTFPRLTSRNGALVAAAALALLAYSRWYALAELRIVPNPYHLIHHWQYLALEDLRTDLWTTLHELHSQPPLWNLIVGLDAIACNADIWCVARLLFLQNLVFSAAIFVCLYLAARVLTGGVIPAILAATLFCLLPSVFFYENYAFYPHFTLFLSCVFMLGAALWFMERDGRGLICCGAALAALALTWTLFHPLFIALLTGGLAATAWKTPSRRLAIAVAALSVAVATLPSIKNQISHGIFASGSWFGLHLAQVSPAPLEDCAFETVIDGIQKDRHIGTALNDESLIPLSKRCAQSAIASILDRPAEFASQRLLAACESLSRWPSGYFYPPLNWSAFPTAGTIPALDITSDPEDQCELAYAPWRTIALLFHLAPLALLPALALLGRSKKRRWFFGFATLYVYGFLFAAHVLNGAEQERMRYTVQNFLWVSSMVGLLAASEWVWSRLRASGEAAAAPEHGAAG